MECVNHILANGTDVWCMLLLKGILLEVADIVMNQLVGLDLVMFMIALRPSSLLLSFGHAPRLQGLSGSRDSLQNASRQFAEGERPGWNPSTGHCSCGHALEGSTCVDAL